MLVGFKYKFIILFEFVYGECDFGKILVNLMFVFEVELFEI